MNDATVYLVTIPRTSRLQDQASASLLYEHQVLQEQVINLYEFRLNLSTSIWTEFQRCQERNDYVDAYTA